jgi:NAD+--dinitrogen-reductase ADP-D-ribosyltransferase
MNTYKQIVDISDQVFAVPGDAQQTLNHCNLPAALLGSLQFQHHPTRLLLDGVHELHASLFTRLDTLDAASQRAHYFMDYMVVQFRLHQLEDAGLEDGKDGKRSKADYLRLLRGWLFDPNGREAAVLKGWVESRFGLLARFHQGPLHGAMDTNAGFNDRNGGNNKSGDNSDNKHYQAYLQLRAQGLLGTNALEAQLDLLYSYCQYELARQYGSQQKIVLYRGIHHLNEYDVLKQVDKHHAVVLLNNLNSFSAKRERADEFGDQVLQVEIPWQKILYSSSLLPGVLAGEDEHLVIGGVYLVHISLW